MEPAQLDGATDPADGRVVHLEPADAAGLGDLQPSLDVEVGVDRRVRVQRRESVDDHRAGVRHARLVRHGEVVRDARPHVDRLGREPVRRLEEEGVRHVVVGQAPTSVWNAYQRGAYRRLTPKQASHLFAGMILRIGAYGDPAAVPLKVWETILSRVSRWTAYTRQWRAGFALSHIAMASVESDGDAKAAIAMGYRVYRIVRPGTPLTSGYRWCPARANGWPRVTCASCGVCNGGTTGQHVQAVVHGARAIHALPVLD